MYQKVQTSLWGADSHHDLRAQTYLVDDTHPKAYKKGEDAILAALANPVAGAKLVVFGEFQTHNVVLPAQQVMPAGCNLYLLIPRTSGVLIAAGADPYLFKTDAGTSLTVYGGGALVGSGVDAGLVDVNGGKFAAHNVIISTVSVVSDYPLLKMTSGQLVVEDSVLEVTSTGGPVMDLTTLASLSDTANWIKNTTIKNATAAGIVHNTGITNFPLYSSQLITVGGLTNVTLAAGNNTNYIK